MPDNPARMSPTTPFSTLARAMARGVRPSDLLPELHRELLAATGAARSVVLEAITATGDYIASSGRGFEGLETLYLSGSEGRELARRAADGAGVVSLSQLPTLARGLATQTALLIPVGLAKRPTVLVAGRPGAPEEEALSAAARAAVEFGIVLEWSRLARESSFHQRMRELSLVFARGVTSAASLGPALDIVAHEANALLGTRRISIWLHDRRARELTLAASSDARLEPARLPADGGEAAARGLRFERPSLIGAGLDRLLVAPLRVWRRALGTLILEGGAPGIDDDHLLDLAHDLARQLAAGIENVQLLDEIVRHRRLLEDTFNSLADLVLVTDRSLRIVQVNNVCVERLGRPREDVVGGDLAAILGTPVAAWAGEDSPERLPLDESETASHEAAQIRQRTFGNLGLPGTFSVTMTPLVNEDEQTVGRVLVARDITLQMRLEEDRELLRARLAQSEKLAALGQFVAGIAHEMNNPLQAIMGHLELMMDHSDRAEPERRELRRIYREAERASRTVRNLLVFTGSRRMARRRLRIDRAVARALASRRAALERAGIAVVLQFSEDLPPITGDPLLLQQALLNLLINAEHAIAERGGGGSVEVATGASGGDVFVTVRDTGTGIPPEVLPRIFEPFFTTKDVGKGTGLGLAITYGIVQEHGGTVQARNDPRGGAVFTITLPVRAEVM
jgi:signal transduction histidine kinase